MKLLSLALTLLLFTATVYAKTEPLVFTKEHSQTAIEILESLSNKHYKKQIVDDAFSSRLLDSYCDALDPVKVYFLKSDVAQFEADRYGFDDALEDGDLSQAFAIFNRFRERIGDRLESNIALLESDFSFDFTVDESIDLDRDSNSWLASPAAADDYWRKRMKDSLLRLALSGKETAAARELLRKRYANRIKQLGQQDADDVVQSFINVMAGLYDPHTSYLAPRTLENFNISMSLSLEGIGAVLQLEDEFTKIVRIVPGGPADKQGVLAAEDKIIGVAQDEGAMVDVIGWRLDDVVDLIRGKKDSRVRLEIIPGTAEGSDKTSIVAIVRDKVKLEEQAAKSRVIELQQGGESFRAGVITVPAFYMDFEAYRQRDPNFKSTSRDVMKLIVDLTKEGVDGIVLDLRNNGGGSLYEATSLTDLFIHPGPVVQIRHADQHVSREQRARQRPFYDGPLMVLINRLSASASEIFAGAIQDYGRGLVVGTTSFGKGTVQVLAPLKQGRLKLTESKFYRVSGQSTQHRGVVPDIRFPSYFDLDEVGESSQDNALPWDSIRKVRHRMYEDFNPLLAVLKSQHQQRVEADPDWRFMLDEIALITEQRALKTFTLNKASREQLKTQREETWLAIENTRRQTRDEPAFESTEAVEAFRKQQKEDEQTPDPILQESAHLLADYARHSSASAETRLVSKELSE
ncbi:MAG: carboxy terminal-processing peptidase [Gammaproteobacteria bacterium]|nr:carboxy terminal-processing peptidase [Gammaproteobacteria bacterium]MBQ0838850.1 carboxy terminal-processing peptidase [Gammaproteobacteria bacterium]